MFSLNILLYNLVTVATMLTNEGIDYNFPIFVYHACFFLILTIFLFNFYLDGHIAYCCFCQLLPYLIVFQVLSVWHT
jgi:hypothetical protein